MLWQLHRCSMMKLMQQGGERKPALVRGTTVRLGLHSTRSRLMNCFSTNYRTCSKTNPTLSSSLKSMLQKEWMQITGHQQVDLECHMMHQVAGPSTLLGPQVPWERGR